MISVTIGADDELASSAPSASPAPRSGNLDSISGNVKEDTNGDGSGDENLSNVFITLMNASGIVVGTTLTNSKRNYLFTDLPSGIFTIV